MDKVYEREVSSLESGETITGKVFDFTKVHEGITDSDDVFSRELIPSDAKITISDDLKCLIRHDKDNVVANKDQIEVKREADGLYFKVSQVPKRIKKLVKDGYLKMASGCFTGKPVFTADGIRKFPEVFLKEISLVPSSSHRTNFIREKKTLYPPECY